MSGYGNDSALICENGHVVNDYATHRAGLNKKFCARCGARALSECPSCRAPIPGGYTYAHDYGTFPTDDFAFERAGFCGECGSAYPWTVATLAASRELADSLEALSDEERGLLKRSFEEIARDTARTEAAGIQIKKLMAKVGGEAGKAVGRLAMELATQAAKGAIFGGGA